MKKIAIAEDHGLIRTGVKQIIENIEGATLSWEAVDGLQALSKLEEDLPDVLVMDLSMPKMTGLEVLAYIRKEKIQVEVLVLSMHKEKEYVHASIEGGASGYVLKDSSDTVIREALESVIDGQEYYGRKVQEILATKGESERSKKDFRITEREMQVLDLLVKGGTNKEVASQLFVSVKTVDSHRTNIMKKLGVHNSAELVWFCLNEGVIELPKKQL